MASLNHLTMPNNTRDQFVTPWDASYNAALTQLGAGSPATAERIANAVEGACKDTDDTDPQEVLTTILDDPMHPVGRPKYLEGPEYFALVAACIAWCSFGRVTNDDGVTYR